MKCISCNQEVTAHELHACIEGLSFSFPIYEPTDEQIQALTDWVDEQAARKAIKSGEVLS